MADPVAPTVTYNMDIVGIIKRLDRFIVELYESQSAGLAETNQFDIERLNTYLAALRNYISWVQSQPQLDLPESSPDPYDLSSAPAVGAIDNESVQDVMRMMFRSRFEVIASQSSRRSDGLMAFDERRLRAVIERIQLFINNYMLKSDPLDLPESSPEFPMPPLGNTGVVGAHDQSGSPTAGVVVKSVGGA